MPLHLALARIAAPAVAVFLATACSDPPMQPRDSGPSLAKGGGSTGTDSRAKWVWADALDLDGVSGAETPAGIRGDGRLADGTAALGAPSEYQDGMCGVQAKIFWYDTRLSQSGDAVFDPDKSGGACGARRTMQYYLAGADGPVSLFPTGTNAQRVMLVQIGAPELRRMNFRIDQSGCAALRFHDVYDYGGTATYEPLGEQIASEVRITRLDANTDARAPRRWRVESQGTHRAVCAVSDRRGVLTNTTTTYYLPFAVEITEIQ